MESKGHEMIIKKDSDIVKGKSEKVRSRALKAKKKYSVEECSDCDSDDESSNSIVKMKSIQ